MVVFCTIGYGDNHGTVTQEYIFFMVNELCGISVFSILMRTASTMMSNNQKDAIQDKLDEFEVWLLRLYRYSKKVKHIKANDIKEISDFMKEYYKKSPTVYFQNNEFFHLLNT